MHELIWYTVSGAFPVIAVVIGFPCVLELKNVIPGLIGIAIIIGFCIHQIYRVIFEARGGFIKNRFSLVHLWDTIISLKGYKEKDDKDKHRISFLVWETALHGNRIPQPFIDHNRRGWHYILSFHSAVLSLALSIIILLAPLFFDSMEKQKCCVYVFGTIIFIFMAIIFYVKAKQTKKSFVDQEKAIICFHSKEFEEVTESLLKIFR